MFYPIFWILRYNKNIVFVLVLLFLKLVINKYNRKHLIMQFIQKELTPDSKEVLNILFFSMNDRAWMFG